MKSIKYYFFSFVLFSFTFSAFGQIKVWAGGSTVIGSTSLSTFNSRLHVVGNSVFTTYNSNSTSSAFIRGSNSFSNSTTPDYSWFGNEQTGIFHPALNEIGFTVAGVEKAKLNNWQFELKNLQYGLRINSGGVWPNLQIKVTAGAPSANYGYVMSYNNSDVFYVLGTGDIFYKNGWIGSDSAFKTDVKQIKDPLNKILNITGVTFKYNYVDTKLNDTNETSIGLIAQDVQRVVPEAVKLNKEGYKSVNYQGLIGLLVEAIKYQNKQIDTLHNLFENHIYQKNKNIELYDVDFNNYFNYKLNKNKWLGTRRSRFNMPNFIKAKETFFLNGKIIKKFSNAKVVVLNPNGEIKKEYPILKTGFFEFPIDANKFNIGLYRIILVVNDEIVEIMPLIISE